MEKALMKFTFGIHFPFGRDYYRAVEEIVVGKSRFTILNAGHPMGYIEMVDKKSKFTPTHPEIDKPEYIDPIEVGFQDCYTKLKAYQV